MKGRRHRLQYKKKVNPELVVDVKPSLRQRKLQEEKLRRQQMRDEYWRRRDEERWEVCSAARAHAHTHTDTDCYMGSRNAMHLPWDFEEVIIGKCSSGNANSRNSSEIYSMRRYLQHCIDWSLSAHCDHQWDSCSINPLMPSVLIFEQSKIFFLEKVAHRADNLTAFLCQLSWNLGASSSWNPQGLSRPVMGMLYFFTKWTPLTLVLYTFHCYL